MGILVNGPKAFSGPNVSLIILIPLGLILIWLLIRELLTWY